MGQAVRLTDKTFEQEVLRSECPVLVEFWASWCPPCKMVEPVMEQLAEEYANRVLVGKLHVDRNPKMRDRYQILGVPTFAVFQEGELVSRRVGAQSKGQLESLIGEVLQDQSA
jgi:thioredoxin 1